MENKLKKRARDKCLQGLFKFHIHISRQIWCTFMVSKRNTLFHVLLCYAFFIRNVILDAISLFGSHTGLQRVLECTRWEGSFCISGTRSVPGLCLASHWLNRFLIKDFCFSLRSFNISFIVFSSTPHAQGTEGEPRFTMFRIMRSRMHR